MKMLNTVASWGMLLAILISFLMAVIDLAAPVIEPFLLFIVAVLGIIVGYINITQSETMKALWWSIGFGLIGFGFIATIPFIGVFLGPFVKTIGVFFVFAAGTFLFVLGMKLFGKK